MSAGIVEFVGALPQLVAQSEPMGRFGSFILRVLHEPFIIPIVAIVGGISCGLIGMVMHYFHQNRLNDIEASLKHSMLERGMSADEIERVLNAHMPSNKAMPWSKCGPRANMARTEPLRER